MASSFSPTHLYSAPWSSSVNLKQTSNGFNTNRRHSIVVNSMNRTVRSLSIRMMLKGSLSSSHVKTEARDRVKTVSTLRELCHGHVPEHVICRMEEVGYVLPTNVQLQALPILFSGRDCVLHAQTGSGKTLAYLLQIFSVINTQRSAVQALIVVPTRELGMQVAKVARMLAARPEPELKSCTVMALLDGGTLRRHKSWLKAEPPTVIVSTLGSLSQMLEKQYFRLEKVQVLVIDEVDFMFNSAKQVGPLRRLLTSYSSSSNCQTIFASASIPQHRRFLYDCVQQKWTKGDVVHAHVNPVEPMPSCLQHRFLVCNKGERHLKLLSVLQLDAPQSAIIFVGEQSEKSKKAGYAPSTTLLVDFLKASHVGCSKIILLEENINFNERAASLSDVRAGRDYLLVATDIAARGVDLPETTHIYNFDLPKDAVNYLHRAGRTGKHRHTAGLARRFVRGKRRVPAPPPSITATTVLASLFSISRSLNCGTWHNKDFLLLSLQTHLSLTCNISSERHGNAGSGEIAASPLLKFCAFDLLPHQLSTSELHNAPFPPC